MRAYSVTAQALLSSSLALSSWRCLWALLFVSLTLSGCGDVSTTTTTSTTTQLAVDAPGGVSSIAFTADSRWLVVGSGNPFPGSNNTYTFYNISSSPPVADATLTNFSKDDYSRVEAITAISNQWLAIMTDYDKIRVYNASVHPPTYYATFSPNVSSINLVVGFAFSDDSELLAVRTDVSLSVFSVRSQGILWSEDLVDDCAGANSGNPSFSAGSMLLAIGCSEHWNRTTEDFDNLTVRVYDMAQDPPRLRQILPAGFWVRSVAFSGDDHWLAVGLYEPYATLLYDMRASPPLLAASLEEGMQVHGLAFSGDSAWLAIIGANGTDTVFLYDMRANPPVLSRTFQAVEPMGEQVVDVAFSPDSTWLAFGSYEYRDSPEGRLEIHGSTYLHRMGTPLELTYVV